MIEKYRQKNRPVRGHRSKTEAPHLKSPILSLGMVNSSVLSKAESAIKLLNRSYVTRSFETKKMTPKNYLLAELKTQKKKQKKADISK